MTQDNAQRPLSRTGYFRLPAADYVAVEAVARRCDRSVSYVIREAVREYLARGCEAARPNVEGEAAHG